MAAVTTRCNKTSFDYSSDVRSRGQAANRAERPIASAEHLLHFAPWTASLTPDELMIAQKGMLQREFVRGSYICHRHSRFEYWTGVISGLVKISTMSRDGRTTTLAGVRAGGWFGEGSILKDEPGQYDIVAIQDTRLAMLNKAAFNWLHNHSWGFRHFLIRQLNERVGQLMSARESDRLLSPTERLAQTLCSLFNPVLSPGCDSLIEISQEELSHLSGLSRATISKSLKDLELKRLIAGSRELITVLDLPGLSLLAAR
jgi:CRP/FNR family cyclic AMP-dependent transcriptional regulator